jgi:hypothetical protein
MCYGCWEEHGKPSIVNKLTPEEPESKAPTLEWFLSLDSETQNSIWSQLRYMLHWSGCMSSPHGVINRGIHANDLFDALREAGADWEEYT